MLLVIVMTLGLLAGCKKKEETKVDKGDRTLTVGIPQDSNIPDYDTNAFSLYLEETLNIDIEWDYFARNGAKNSQAKYLERAYYSGRTIDDVSYISNDIRKKTFDLRTRNPLPTLGGKVKGWFDGAMYGLGNNLFTVCCASLAILSKGALAKLGAIGVAAKFGYDILRSGFGIGKEHPMN